MSIRLMSDVWQMQMPPTEKLVLLALADAANDDGVCWPSIASVARKSGLSERSVQRTIRAFEAGGLLSRHENRGKGCRYRLTVDSEATPDTASPATKCHRRHDVTPDTESPVTMTTPTPDTVSPKPSRTINTSEAKASSVKRTRPSDPWSSPPDGVDPDHWRDFLANRKRKKLPNTPTAHSKLMRDLERLSDEEWPPGRVLQHAAERGWAGIYDPRDGKENGERAYNNRRGTRENPIFAARRRLGIDDEPGMGTGPRAA